MGSEYYKVDVVHFMDPHLIWVTTRKRGDESKFFFEQIGLYGILPQNLTVDIDGVLKTEVSEMWQPAALATMTRSFQDAAEVLFSPTFIDKKSSIFDDNTHKFGDIRIVKKDGTTVVLADEVVQSAFAYADEQTFHQKLVTSNLKTKLGYVAKHEVMKKLKEGFTTRRIPEKIWLLVLSQQTLVFEKGQEIEEAVKNRKITLQGDETLETVLKNTLNKMNDLKFCEDIDEVSAGRAYSQRPLRSTTENTNGTNVNVTWRNRFVWLAQKAKENRQRNSESECNMTFSSDEINMNPEEKKHHGLNRFTNNRNFRNNNENFRDNRNVDNQSRKSEASQSSSSSGFRDIRRNSFNDRDDQNCDHNIQTHRQNNYRVTQTNYRSNANNYRNNMNNYRNNQNNYRNNQNNDHDKQNNDGNNQNYNRYNRNNVRKPQKAPGQETRNIAYGPAGLSHTKFAIKPRSEDDEERRKATEEKNMCANTTPEVNSKLSNSETVMPCKNNVRIVHQAETSQKNKAFELLKQKRKILELRKKVTNVVSKSDNDNDNDFDDDMSVLDRELRETYKSSEKPVETVEIVGGRVQKPNVNPYRNLDGTISVFVDKLTTPVLMVHTKKGNHVEPVTDLRDIPFGKNIHCVLRDMQITRPMKTQTVSWMSILRGHSFFVVSPHRSGNTMGYLPAVCRLTSDYKESKDKCQLRCIIVCATSRSLQHVQNMCKSLVHNLKVFACHAGMSDLFITTSLLNGCDILVCTPSMLVRLMQKDLGLDLHYISTFVIDDCEYISEFYTKEIKFCVMNVFDVVRKRPNREWKCQFVAVSRTWCDFMSTLAKKAPDSIVCISAFEECVLYSKAATSVEFLAEEKKIAAVIKFLEDIDKSKKTVIVCKSDSEVKLVADTLINLKHIVFSCDSTMTVEDLYALDKALKEYQEPVLGPILVCCDGNLCHLNVSDAHYLIQYSLPKLFSMFCNRFAVLNENYASVFNEEKCNVKIKILLDNSNIEALPKILHFVKRCMRDVPPHLDEITSKVVREKNLVLAKGLVPICKMLLTLGECANYWNCHDRHCLFEEYDAPKEWLPVDGVINFRVINYHSAAHYSARLLSYTTRDRQTKTFPQNYSLLSLKMGMYYSKESNKRLQGILNTGDICAVTLKQNLFVRCQIIKVMNTKGNNVLIKLIDEEIYKYVTDTSLYHLPEELKQIETHIVNVALANIRPEDKDITYSDLAEKHIKQFIEESSDVFVRGKIAMVIGNTVFVENLEVCQELTSLKEVVVKHHLRQELLDGHAVPCPDHLNNLKNLCDFVVSNEDKPQDYKPPKPLAKPLPKCRWAHLDDGVFSSVMFMTAENPDQFFIRHAKFDKCLTALISDIKLHVAENPQPKEEINEGDIVIAEFPDDTTFERARVESSVTNEKAKCFFVDQAEWREVAVNKILPITEKFITQLPFQAIECRLVGVKPFGENWTDFTTNFFINSCFDDADKHKFLYTKYFKKEKAAVTEGHKYAVVLIDTYSEEDIIVNQMLMIKNLAEENDEVDLLNDVGFEKKVEAPSDVDDDDEPKPVVSQIDKSIFLSNTGQQPSSNNNVQYVPVTDYDDEADDEYDFVADDPEALLPVPLSQIMRVKELPDAEWSEQDVALPLTYDIPADTSQSDLVDDDSIKTNTEETKSNITDFENLAVETKAIVEEVETNTVDEIVNTVHDIKPKVDDVKPKVEDVQNTAEVICKPKVLWSQTRTVVTLKIQLIVDNYDMTFKDRRLSMAAIAQDTSYGFDIELYGVVTLKNCSHANKGQYILVKLFKRRAQKWLSLTTDRKAPKWIAYDLETIEVSSDEEFEVVNPFQDMIQHRDEDSDSDDDFYDDTTFTYDRYRYGYGY